MDQGSEVSDARRELIAQGENLLAEWKGRSAVDGNFSGELHSPGASAAYSSDPLYRAVMRLADSFADALAHGRGKVDDLSVNEAAEALCIGFKELARGSSVVSGLLARYY